MMCVVLDKKKVTHSDPKTATKIMFQNEFVGPEPSSTVSKK